MIAGQGETTPRSATLPAGARLADAVVLLLVVASAVVELTGGFSASPWGVRLSVTSPSRVLVWAGIVLLLRHAWVRRPTLWQRLGSWRLFVDTGEPLAPPVPRSSLRMHALVIARLPRAGLRDDVRAGRQPSQRDGPRRSALLVVAPRLGLLSAADGSVAPLRREHLSPRAPHARVLGRDARPGTDCGALALDGRRRRGRAQSAVAGGERVLRRDDVLAGAGAWSRHRSRGRVGRRVRLLSAPLAVSCAPRARDHRVDAARDARPASHDGERAGPRRSRARRGPGPPDALVVLLRPVSLVEPLRRGRRGHAGDERPHSPGRTADRRRGAARGDRRHPGDDPLLPEPFNGGRAGPGRSGAVQLEAARLRFRALEKSACTGRS